MAEQKKKKAPSPEEPSRQAEEGLAPAGESGKKEAGEQEKAVPEDAASGGEKQKDSAAEGKKKFTWNRKKTIWTVGIAAAITAALLLTLGSGSSQGKAYVFPLSTVTGGSAGTANRFIGTVEPQESKDVSFDTSKTLGEIYVQVGDEVQAGQKLFSYDTSSMNMELEQLNIDLESIRANISNYQDQLSVTTGSTDRAILQRQIQDEQYNLQKKLVEINAKKKEIADTDVLSPIDGVIKSIVTPSEAVSGSAQPQITIVAKGEYLVKATVSEMNISSLQVGQAMLVRSRVDETQTWTGKITSIDTSSPVSSDNAYYYEGGTENTASKYYFYVGLDNPEGLLMGQHVTVEADQSGGLSGLVLGSYFINDIDSRPYVWKEENGRLTKAYVTLGQYSEDTDEYQITEGLEASDSIAFPSDSYHEGMQTTTEITEDVNNSTEDMDNPEDSGGEEEPALQEETDLESTGGEAEEAQ